MGRRGKGPRLLTAVASRVPPTQRASSAEDISRLDLARPFDLEEGKRRWLAALAGAETFVEERPAEEVGCLYYAPECERFEQPAPGVPLDTQGLVTHFGRPGGVLPRPTDQSLEGL